MIKSEIEQVDSLFFVHAAQTELDVFTAPEYRDALAAATEHPDSKIIIADLSGVKFIDSTGLALLLGGMRRCQKENKSYFIDLTNDRSGMLQKVFSITGMDKTVTIIPPPNN